jgi:hypothetical protein
LLNLTAPTGANLKGLNMKEYLQATAVGLILSVPFLIEIVKELLK